jgi:hypothetical protein
MKNTAGVARPADILSDFLNRLGDVDASILMMYMDGLTADEISGVLGRGSSGSTLMG